jgi:Zn-dependent protease
LGDLTLQHIVLRIGSVLLIAAVSGFAIAVTACALGDPGPRYDNRLALNPLRHVDPIGGALMVLFAVGWIRPITVDPRNVRPGRVGLLVVTGAAVCATIALVAVLRLTRPFLLNLLPDTEAATYFVFVETVGQLCVGFLVFNMLPLPPLTAQYLLLACFPQRSDAVRRAQPYVAAVLALLIVTGVVPRLLAPAEAAIVRVFLDG